MRFQSRRPNLSILRLPLRPQQTLTLNSPIKNQNPNCTPVYKIELLLGAVVEPSTPDRRITKPQSRMLMSGEPLIEIVSIPETIYEIEYS